MRTVRLHLDRSWGRILMPALLLAGLGQTLPTAGAGPKLDLRLRSRVETAPASGQCQVVEKAEAWEPTQTAIIVCDMWDLHHCLNAVRRAKEMAPRMDQVLKLARERGVQIIHAPSGCMDAYKDHEARRRAIETPRSKSLPAEIGKWCYQIPAEEKGTYPIDQSNGGEDDDPAEHAAWAASLAKMGRNPKAPWKSQTELLTIVPETDLISDSGEEIWSVLEHRGIKNVVLLGVHLNMCVLGRPFGLRQMAKNGRNVVLMRDMTDTMYDPHSAPRVSHFAGTDLMVEHVEKFVCPTVTSDQLLGGTPARFQGDKRQHVVFVIAEDEYKTETTLPVFAAAQLGRNYHVSYVLGSTTERNDLPGLGILAVADTAVISVRRRVLPDPQLALIRAYVAGGKSLIGIRTASHAFAAAGNKPAPAGHTSWGAFDPEVLGGNYHGHHKAGEKVTVEPSPMETAHPIRQGVDATKLVGHGSLYKVSPLAKTATPLLVGTIPGEPSEPIAWVNAPASGGRVFYTSLGHVDDFADPQFNRLLRNAVDWTCGRGGPSVATTEPPVGVGSPGK
ncbi:Trehalose utilisation [Singulisphaera sp. GP187]|uniref:ThuA domain-containing protein n=1 Tax=Singulisphaera sp. GP187 TaxID=1882752 RepID=UPI000928ED12|nr:ThuA domain-containing protein [Singulisphaera sp. GP187]SIO66863.1 Trehalose utilisation [Singulisphaera sp. GP187]